MSAPNSLAYVWTRASPDTLFEEALVEDGLAQGYTVQPNDKYQGRFDEAQQQAIAANGSIWLRLPYGKQSLQNDRGNGIGGGMVDRSRVVN